MSDNFVEIYRPVKRNYLSTRVHARSGVQSGVARPHAHARSGKKKLSTLDGKDCKNGGLHHLRRSTLVNIQGSVTQEVVGVSLLKDEITGKVFISKCNKVRASMYSQCCCPKANLVEM